jgi:hypothetical protein
MPVRPSICDLIFETKPFVGFPWNSTQEFFNDVILVGVKFVKKCYNETGT